MKQSVSDRTFKALAAFIVILVACTSTMHHEQSSLKCEPGERGPSSSCATIADGVADVSKRTDAEDEEFDRRVTKEQDFTKKAQAVHSMLKSAFLPLAIRLDEVIRSMPEETLNSMIKAIRDIPVHEDTFVTKHGHKTIATNFPVAQPEGTKGEFDPLNVSPYIQRKDYLIFHAVDVAIDRIPFTGDGENWRKDAIGANVFSNSPHYLWVDSNPDLMNKCGKAFDVLGMTITPVGVYGKDFSRKMLQTTRLMMLIAFQKLQKDAQVVAGKTPTLLTNETARFKDATDNLGPLGSLMEGFLSLNQVISAALADGIPGDETGDMALHDFIFGGSSRMGLASELTSAIPMGLIGPMAMSGTHFKHALVRTAEQKVEWSKEIIEKLKMLKLSTDRRGGKGLCPFASLFAHKPKDNGPDGNSESITGLQLIARLYWKLFQKVAAR